ncbi:hypothetical protein llap_18562 [Limosa lapponica baueri]|uniref:Nardilysin n=1 Tax=Limosa lapponica baueri TaxID=1758121 RepID=A0A2I0TBG2_LIMLA|nr:hypothetical protein llap_18562 [Limosa lapponica baueri]
MGSLKYPDENGFDAFLKKHGGSDNASTDCERTVFQFDVQRKYFKEALDRSACNADTLKHEPKMNNIDTYTRLRDFWQRHYSAHYMTLVVQSKETLDTLEKWVKEIFSQIPNKFWALALYGGNGETGFEQNSTYSIFSISVTLTDEGYKHFYEVAHVVFQIWEEIQKIEANEFHYQEQTDPVDYVESLCENMQLFQKEDFLTGDQLLFEYKPEIIADALNQLSPQKANLVLLSAANEGQCHLKESIVLFDTFVSILSHNLGEPAYEADVAQLEYKLVAGEHGLVIRVKGFNHKLPTQDNAANAFPCAYVYV